MMYSVLGWGPLDAEPETRIQVQMIYSVSVSGESEAGRTE